MFCLDRWCLWFMLKKQRETQVAPRTVRRDLPPQQNSIWLRERIFWFGMNRHCCKNSCKANCANRAIRYLKLIICWLSIMSHRLERCLKPCVDVFITCKITKVIRNFYALCRSGSNFSHMAWNWLYDARKSCIVLTRFFKSCVFVSQIKQMKNRSFGIVKVCRNRIFINVSFNGL